MRSRGQRINKPREKEKPTPDSYSDPAAEMACIGTMAMAWGENTDANNRDLISQCHEIVAAEDFSRDMHAQIVQTIYDMYWQQKPIDLLTIGHELRERGIYDDVGGVAYLTACIEHTPTTSHIETYARIVREKAELRRAWMLVEKAESIIIGGGSLSDIRPVLRDIEDIQERNTPSGDDSFSAADLMTMDLPPLRWAIPDFLPAGFNLFGGKPKGRKSWFWLQTCLAVATGGRAMGSVGVPRGEALYLALEDTPQRLRDRLQKLLHGAQAPAGLHLATEWPRADRGGCQKLDRWLSAHPECRLVVVDTLQKFRPQQKEGGNAYGQDYDATDLLKKIADKHNVALVAIHHTTKANADDVFMTFSGTLALTGGADGMFVLVNRGEQDAVLHMQGRDLELQKIALRWDPQLWQWNAEGDAEQLVLSEEREAILDVLRAEGRSMAIHEIARALQVKPENVKALLWKMKQSGEVVSDDKGRYRAPRPDENAPAQSPAQGAVNALFTAFTAFTVYQDTPESPRLDAVIEHGEIKPDLVDFLPEPPFMQGPGQSTVNAVNAVNAKNAQKACLEYLRGLQVEWTALRTAHLEKIAAFCWWYRETFEGRDPDQDAFNGRFGAFCAEWPDISPNCPPWLKQPQK